jgi:hypothetical protein
MPFMAETSDALTRVRPSTEPELRRCANVPAPQPEAADDGPARDPDSKSTAAQSKSGWIAALTRWASPSRDRRPYYAHRSERDFIADARMAREMERL